MHISSSGQIRSVAVTKLKKLNDFFTTSFKETSERCHSESENMRLLVFDTVHVLPTLVPSERFRISLMEIRIVELARLLIHIVFLTMSGLYRNAFDNIRYILESMVQSLYIDSRHPSSGLRARIEILKEIEDKREYRAISLIDKLEIDHKDALKKQYKNLSQIIHPSHRSVVEILGYGQTPSGLGFVAPIDCKEISNIFNSMRMTIDMILFLYVSCLPTAGREKFRSNRNLIKYCDKYTLVLVSKTLRGNPKN